MKHFKTNRRGFSLVELIAAVAILAVVVTPLLHSFVTATRVSRRSREIAEATLAGKNILEAIDASMISDWQEISDSNLASELLTYGDTPASITPIGQFDERGNLVTVDDGFTIGIKDVVAGSRTFDAKVEFSRGDANENVTDANGNTVASTSHGLHLINDVEIAQYSPMDANFAQDFINTSNPDYLAEHEFLDEVEEENPITQGLGNKIGYMSDKEYHMDRTIKIYTYMDSEGLAHASVIYRYDIRYKIVDEDGYVIYNNAGNVQSREWTTEYRYGIFNGGGFEPQNKDGSVSIYMEYFPLYDPVKNEYGEGQGIAGMNAGHKYGPDKFEIYKISGETATGTVYETDLNLFIFKQKPMAYNAETGEYTRIDFDTPVQNYSANITMYMPEDFEIYSEDDENPPETLIYTNIDWGENDSSKTQNHAYKDQFSFDVSTAYFYGIDVNDMDTYEEYMMYDLWENTNYAERFYLVRQEKSVRIYNVKITVYPSGAFAPAREETDMVFNGNNVTIVDTSASAFNSNPIYTFEGSKTP